jgi:hypothetical protein
MKLGKFVAGVGHDDASEPIGCKDGADFPDLLDFLVVCPSFVPLSPFQLMVWVSSFSCPTYAFDDKLFPVELLPQASTLHSQAQPHWAGTVFKALSIVTCRSQSCMDDGVARFVLILVFLL